MVSTAQVSCLFTSYGYKSQVDCLRKTTMSSTYLETWSI